MTEHSYGWPIQPKDEQDLTLPMPHYFIQMGKVVQVGTRSLKLRMQSSGQHRQESTVDPARQLTTRRGRRRDRSTLWKRNLGRHLFVVIYYLFVLMIYVLFIFEIKFNLHAICYF